MYSLEEIESLRLKLIRENNYTEAFIEHGPMVDIHSFHQYLEQKAHLRSLLEEKFTQLPLLLGNCPKGMEKKWHSIILAWRLEIGK